MYISVNLLEFMVDFLNDLNNDFPTSTTCDDFFEINKFLALDGIGGVNVVHSNIRSLQKHFEELEVYLSGFVVGPDVVVLSETFQINNVNRYKIEGYDIIYNEGKINKNDGVVIYIKDTANYTSENITYNDLSFLRIEMGTSSNGVIAISGVYRPFDCSTEQFNNALNMYLGNHAKTSTEVIIGDMNIDILHPSPVPNYIEDYLNTMAINCFSSFINTNTRVENGRGSCIDHVFIRHNNRLELPKAAIFRNKITDHFVTCVRINTSIQKSARREDFNRLVDYACLTRIVSEINWNEHVSFSDPERSIESFIAVLLKAVELASSVRGASKHLQKRKVWMTSGLLTSINKKNKMYLNTLKEPKNLQLNEYYRQYKNRLNHLIKIMKSNFYRSRIIGSVDNPRKIWQITNEICGRQRKKSHIHVINYNNKLINNTVDICNTFNEYFVNIGASVSDTRTNRDYNPKPIKKVGSSFFLKPVSDVEVANIITSFKSDKAPGEDGLTARLLKHLKNYITKPLANLVNLSFTSGIFPGILKRASVTVLHKGGKCNNVGNYRPISLISNIAKIFEKLLSCRMHEFIDKKGILSDQQYGFRPHRSTQDAITYITNRAYKSIDSSNPSIAAFLDLTKAFDTINHSILLAKLETYGFRGKSFDLIKSYLTGRTQSVKIDSITSNSLVVQCGVPQGTILGPLFFILYINDLFHQVDNVDIISYADDTALFVQSDSWCNARLKMEQCLQTLNAWFKYNKLVINPKKSKFMCFSSYKKHLPVWRTIQIHEVECDTDQCSCNNSIHRVESFRYLGIVIDSHLKWEEHIDNLCRNIRQIFYIFKSLRDLMPLKLIKNVYFALVQSLLTYGILVWGGTHVTVLNKINVIQRCVLKIAFKKPFLFPTKELFELTQVLTIRQLYVLDIIKYYVKNRDCLTYMSHPYPTRCSNDSCCRIFRAQKTLTQKYFVYFLPRIYNMLPSGLKSYNGSRYSFIREVKRWIVASGPRIDSVFASLV